MDIVISLLELLFCLLGSLAVMIGIIGGVLLLLGTIFIVTGIVLEKHNIVDLDLQCTLTGAVFAVIAITIMLL